MKNKRIFIVGPTAVGKSTIGAALAKFLQFNFVDSDRAIEAHTGVDVSRIFKDEGEVGFRKREAGMIDELSQRDYIVLATGGGAVLNADTRARLQARGYVIYLTAPVQVLVGRTAYDKARPLLQQAKDREHVLRRMMVMRGPLYESIADHTLNTATLSRIQIIRRLSKVAQKYVSVNGS